MAEDEKQPTYGEAIVEALDDYIEEVRLQHLGYTDKEALPRTREKLVTEIDIAIKELMERLMP